MTLGRRSLLKLAGVAGAAIALERALRTEGVAHAATATALPFAVSTPVHVDAAALRVRDLDVMTAYYRDVLGLVEMERTLGGVVLGAGGTPLLHLLRRSEAGVEDPASAGLFHIAYLMPTREDLARWLVHAARIRVPVDGFADHSVSEAIYLTDPEGNGIEVYADRPKDSWQWRDGIVTMGTKELDIEAIVALTDRTVDGYELAPRALRIGHVHLRVGDVEAARGFYEAALGLASTTRGRADAAFLSSGGYHHHVAVNTWRSAGAGGRDMSRTGLDWFSLRVTDPGVFEAQKARLAAAGGLVGDDASIEAEDPWGTKVRLILA